MAATLNEILELLNVAGLSVKNDDTSTDSSDEDSSDEDSSTECDLAAA